jgi:hypothetical protein
MSFCLKLLCIVSFKAGPGGPVSDLNDLKILFFRT